MKNKRFYQLLQLARLLHELLPQQAVQHSWKEVLRQRLQSRPHAELGDVLIRQMTLLNRSQRICQQGAWQSETQDLLMALQLLQGEYGKHTLLNPRLQLAYSRLKSRLGKQCLFRRRDVERITGYRKTESWRLLQRLEQCDKIERVGGSKQAGYFYRIRE